MVPFLPRWRGLIIAGLIGEVLGLPSEDLGDLHWAGMLHDLGKAGISPEVLRKQGPLSDAEWIELKKHALRHDRVGRFTHPEAVAFVAARAGRDFDPDIVRAFAELSRRGVIDGNCSGDCAPR